MPEIVLTDVIELGMEQAELVREKETNKQTTYLTEA